MGKNTLQSRQPPTINPPTKLSSPNSTLPSKQSILRFDFQDKDAEKSFIAFKIYTTKHKEVLERMKTIFKDEIGYHDINNKQFNIEDYPTEEAERKKLFTSWNSCTKMTKLFTITTVVSLKIPLYKLQQESSIASFCKKWGLFIRRHKWDINELDIKSPGVLFQCDPNTISAGVANQLLGKLITDSGFGNIEVRVKRTNIATASANNGRLSCSAYELQCRQSDYNKLLAFCAKNKFHLVGLGCFYKLLDIFSDSCMAVR